jgi:hypothetical protein
MKTIEVTDEQYEALKEMQNELNTQDNRHTRDPMYVIMDTHKVPTSSDYSDDYEWFNSNDSETIGNDEELFEFLCENHESKLLEVYNGIYDRDVLFKVVTEITDSNKEEIKEWLLDEIKYENDLDFLLDLDYISKVYLLDEESIMYSQGFPVSFFEKDLKEHLKSNSYHYSAKATTYACSLWRSSRMERLRDILVKIELK